MITISEPNSKPSAGNNNTGDVKEILESLIKRVEEIEAGLASGVQDEEEEEEIESGVSIQTSNGENRGTRSAIETDHKTINQQPGDDDGEFTFFPALDHLKPDTKVKPASKNLKIKS